MKLVVNKEIIVPTKGEVLEYMIVINMSKQIEKEMNEEIIKIIHKEATNEKETYKES